VFKDESVNAENKTLAPDLISNESTETFHDKSQEFSAVLGPLDSGYGITLGHPLRRVLLSSISGFAIVGLKIKGVKHIFSSVDGVAEDVEHIILNLKKVVFKSNLKSFSLSVSVTGKTEVTADMFKSSDVEILNPEQFICSVSDGVSFDIEIYVQSGVGYVSAHAVDVPEGYIALDAAFSPILNVFYDVVPVRVGDKTDLDELHFKVKTDGSVDAKKCFEQGCNIIIEQFYRMISNAQVLQKKTQSLDDIVDDRWMYKISSLNLTGRAKTFVEYNGLVYIGDLIQYTRQDISDMHRFGEKTVKDLETALANKYNLTLDIQIKNWELIRPVEEQA